MEDNITMDLTVIRWGKVECIYMAQNRNHRNLPLESINVRAFLISWKSISWFLLLVNNLDFNYWNTVLDVMRVCAMNLMSKKGTFTIATEFILLILNYLSYLYLVILCFKHKQCIVTTLWDLPPEPNSHTLRCYKSQAVNYSCPKLWT
jgi:hypothetical protein